MEVGCIDQIALGFKIFVFFYWLPPQAARILNLSLQGSDVNLVEYIQGLGYLTLL